MFVKLRTGWVVAFERTTRIRWHSVWKVQEKIRTARFTLDPITFDPPFSFIYANADENTFLRSESETIYTPCQAIPCFSQVDERLYSHQHSPATQGWLIASLLTQSRDAAQIIVLIDSRICGMHRHVYIR